MNHHYLITIINKSKLIKNKMKLHLIQINNPKYININNNKLSKNLMKNNQMRMN